MVKECNMILLHGRKFYFYFGGFIDTTLQNFGGFIDTTLQTFGGFIDTTLQNFGGFIDTSLQTSVTFRNKHFLQIYE
jgi:hypothetical protein